MNAARCPFCNSLKLQFDMNSVVYWVACLECGAAGPHGLTKARALRFWNSGCENPAALCATRNPNQSQKNPIE